MEGHSGSFFYYVPIILIGLMPYTTLVIRAVSRIRTIFSNPLDLYMWLWFGFVFFFFSMAGTKLHHYVVYGYIPLIIAMARVVDIGRVRRIGWFVAPTVVFLVVLFFIGDLTQMLLPTITDAFTLKVIPEALEQFGPGYRIWIGGTIAAIALVASAKKIGFISKIVLTGCLFFALITGQVLPKVADILQSPIKTAALMAKEQNLEVVMWKMNYPSFHVYYGKPALKQKPAEGDVVITKADKLDRIASHDVLFQKYGIVLTRINQL
jgi:4-amino-4-deoxy-L-arabinose transferase-like glycosyltransferase